MNKNYLTTIFLVLFASQIGSTQKSFQGNEVLAPVSSCLQSILSIPDTYNGIGNHFNSIFFEASLPMKALRSPTEVAISLSGFHEPFP